MVIIKNVIFYYDGKGYTKWKPYIQGFRKKMQGS